MLRVVGAPSLDALASEIVPPGIRLDAPPALPPAETEHGYLTRLRGIAGRNQVFRSYIGLGYHDTITPSVIRRMILENPGWYTPYTPYQSEIAQGRLEALLTFQTMVTDLTGMEVANASLLDEATAAAEAMALLLRVQKRAPASGVAPVVLVADSCFPQTIAVVRGRAEPLGIEVRIVPPAEMTFEAPRLRRHRAVAGCLRSAAGSRAAHRAGARGRRRRGRRRRPPGAHAGHAAGRARRRRRLRQLPAVWRAARVRRTARRLLRHAPDVRAAHARAA